MWDRLRLLTSVPFSPVRSCGKVYSQGRVSHDPVRLQGMSDMRRPETAAELMKFLQAMNWLRTRYREWLKPRYSSRRVDGGKVKGFDAWSIFCGMESTFVLITATLLTFLTLKRA